MASPILQVGDIRQGVMTFLVVMMGGIPGIYWIKPGTLLNILQYTGQALATNKLSGPKCQQRLRNAASYTAGSSTASTRSSGSGGDKNREEEEGIVGRGDRKSI